MKRTRSFRLVAAGVVVALTSAVAVQTTTQTASANDYQIIYDNLDDALGVLLTGVGDAVTEYLANMNAVDAAHVFNDALVAAGSALIAGTAQFGALGFGLVLLQGSLEAALDPFIGVLDDPASIADLFTADDLSTIFDRLVPAIGLLLVGDEFGTPGVIDAIASLLEGQVTFGISDSNGVILDALIAIINTAGFLFTGTSFGAFGNLATIGGLIGILALDGFVGTYFQAVEDALVPVLVGQLGVVTAPLASLIRGLAIPALPIPLP